MRDITQALTQVQDSLRQAAEKHQRNLADIQLLAVSKTRPATDLEAAYNAGQTAFGENYLQEALDKIEALQHLPLEWHFIGPIQSNKTKPIAEHFDWVHSVDRLKIARRLSEQRPPDLTPLNICLQINISAEASKSGITLAELPALAQEISALPNITLRGLMAIPAPADNFDDQRIPHRALKKALDDLNSQGLNLDTLSMGMSGDMEAAIAEGSTMVRIGTAIFGKRTPKA